MKHILVIAIAGVTGFGGGVLGTLTIHGREQVQTAQRIRAQSFELLNQAGQVISYWGTDEGQNAVLAFGENWPAAAPPGWHPLRPGNRDDQRLAIGIIEASPFLHLKGADGKTRAWMHLNSWGKPMFSLWDETGPRVSLGVEQSDTPGPQDNDWTLDFGPESRARIGAYSEKRNGERFVYGIFSVRKDPLKYP